MRHGIDVQESIIEIIQSALKDEQVDPGVYYFKEGDFADRLGVGRSTIREAITSLEIRGFVKRVHGRGIMAIDGRVEALSNSMNDMLKRSDFSYMEILQFRDIMEVKGAGLAATYRQEANLNRMNNCLEVMESNVSYKAYLDADFSFHREVMKATQNQMLVAMLDAYSRVIRYVIEMSTDVDYRPEQDHHFHKHIYHAIASGERHKAEEAMSSHLSASTDNVDTLKKIKSICW